MLTVSAGLGIRAGVSLGPVHVSPCTAARGAGRTAIHYGEAADPLPPPPSSPRGLQGSAAIGMKGNNRSLAFSLPLEEVLVEDELPGVLCQGYAA